MSVEAPAGTTRRLVKSPRELLAGLLLLALAATGYFGSFSLDPGQLSAMGPGMMPKITSIGLSLFGAVLLAQSLMLEGPGTGAWNLRGIIFVFGAVLIFAATIRGWGLGVAGPLAVVVSALGDRDTRLIEILPFALAMTLFSAALFKWLLGLPIPLLPPLLGY